MTFAARPVGAARTARPPKDGSAFTTEAIMLVLPVPAYPFNMKMPEAVSPQTKRDNMPAAFSCSGDGSNGNPESIRFLRMSLVTFVFFDCSFVVVCLSFSVWPALRIPCGEMARDVFPLQCFRIHGFAAGGSRRVIGTPPVSVGGMRM